MKLLSVRTSFHTVTRAGSTKPPSPTTTWTPAAVDESDYPYQDNENTNDSERDPQLRDRFLDGDDELSFTVGDVDVDRVAVLDNFDRLVVVCIC